MNRTSLFAGMDDKPLTVSEISFSSGLVGNAPPHLKKVNVLDVKYIPFRSQNLPQVIDYSTRNSVLPCYSITQKILKNSSQYGNNRIHVQPMNTTSVINPRPSDIPSQIPRGFTNPASVF